MMDLFKEYIVVGGMPRVVNTYIETHDFTKVLKIQRDIIDGNLGIYKGAIYENIIADIFNKLGRKLYYFEYRNRLEMDLIVRYKDKVTAVEVKSADNTKSKSMTNIIQNWKVPQGIKLSSKNIKGNETVSNYSTNSGEYGNYYDHKFSESEGIINTGLTTPVCNIYDMGENLWEATSESSFEYDPFVYRGGYYDSSSSYIPAGYRNYGSGISYSFYTFRPTLYVKPV